MSTQIIRGGSAIRVIVQSRSITDTSIVDGYLIITYSDGSFENAGYIGGGGAITPTIYNTLGSSDLTGVEVDGFTEIADSIDTRLTALGY